MPRAGMLLLAFALAACRSSATTSKPAMPVRVTAVTTGSTVPSARYSANVEPSVRVDLAFKMGGYVATILSRKVDGKLRHVQEGDHVAKGEVLARLHEADYLVRVEQARAQLAQAEAALGQAKLDFERAQQLFESQALAQATFDGAKARFDAIRATTAAARALVQQAELARADCSLRAPLDAIILKRLIEVGSLVGPGSGGFVLADTRSMRVVFGVPDVVVNKLKPGSLLEVRIEALPGEKFAGRITRVSPVADLKSRLFDVEVTLANPEQRLRAGMIAALAVPEPGLLAPTPLVPLAAIVRPAGHAEGFAVFVVEHQGDRPIVRQHAVRLGEIVGNQVAVLDGLHAGEQVVISGAALAVDGEAVAIVP